MSLETDALIVSSPESGSRVPGTLAGVILFCSWSRHFTLTVPLSTQEHPAHCQGNRTKYSKECGVTCDGREIPSWGSSNTSTRLVLQKPGRALAV